MQFNTLSGNPTQETATPILESAVDFASAMRWLASHTTGKAHTQPSRHHSDESSSSAPDTTHGLFKDRGEVLSFEDLPTLRVERSLLGRVDDLSWRAPRSTSPEPAPTSTEPACTTPAPRIYPTAATTGVGPESVSRRK